MTISLSEFISQLGSNPALLITVILTLGVILVNGWTDAPNAIATCVSTLSLIHICSPEDGDVDFSYQTPSG